MFKRPTRPFALSGNRSTANTGQTPASRLRRVAGRPAPCLEALEPRQLLAAFTWTGNGDGTSWNSPANWLADSLPTLNVPSLSDSVTITTPANITLGSNAQARSVSFATPGGASSLSNGSLTVANNFTVAPVGPSAALTNVNISIGGNFNHNNGTLSLSGSLSAANAVFQGPINLTGDTTLSAVTTLQLAGSVNGAQSLTLIAGDATVISGAIGNLTPVFNVTTDAPGSLFLSNTITTAGALSLNDGNITLNTSNITANGALTLGSLSGSAFLNQDLTLSGSSVTINSTLDGTHNLSVNSPGLTHFRRDIGASFPLNTITTNAAGSLTIGGSVVTQSNQTYNESAISLASPGSSLFIVATGSFTFAGDVTLTSDVSLNTSGGDITFSGSITGNFSLFLNGTGNTTFSSTLDIFALSITRSGTTGIAANQTAALGLYYDSPILLTASVVLASPQIDIVQGVNSLSNGASALSLISDGPVNVSSAGQSSALASFTSDDSGSGSITVGSIRTNGVIALLDRSVRLRGSLYDTTNAGSITGANFTSTPNNPALTTLDNTVTVSAGVGQVRFNSEVQSTPGFVGSLSVTSAQFTIFGNSVGGQDGADDLQRLGSIFIASPLTIGNAGTSDDRAVRTLDNSPTAMSFAGPVTIADNVLFDTGDTAFNAVVNFAGSVNPTPLQNTNARNVRIRNVGSVIFNADIGTGTAGPLGSLTTDHFAGGTIGGSISLKNVNLSGSLELGDVNITLAGTYTTSATASPVLFYGDVTLNADTTLSSSTSNVTFFSTINSQPSSTRNLTIQSLGTVTLTGAVGNAQPLNAFFSNPGGSLVSSSITSIFGIFISDNTLTLSGELNAGIAALSINSQVIVTGNSVMRSDLNVVLQGNVDGPAGLTFATPSVQQSIGTIGSNTPLSFVTLTTPNVSYAVSSTRAGAFTADTTLLLPQSTIIETFGGELRFNGDVNLAGNSLSLFGGGATEFSGPVTNAASITVLRTGTARLSASQTATGSISYSSDIVLAADVTFSSSTSDILLSGRVDSASGSPSALFVVTPALARFSSVVGDLNPLRRLIVSADTWDATSTTVLEDLFVATTTRSLISGIFTAGTELRIQNTILLTANTALNVTNGPLRLEGNLFGNDPSLSLPQPAGLFLGGSGITVLNAVVDTAYLFNARFDTTFLVNNFFVLGAVVFEGLVNSASDGHWTFAAGGDMDFRGGFNFAGQSVDFIGTGNTRFGADSTFLALNINRNATVTLASNLQAAGHILISDNLSLTQPTTTITSGNGLMSLAGNITGNRLVLNNGGHTALLGNTIDLGSLVSDEAGSFELPNFQTSIVLRDNEGLELNDITGITLRGTITAPATGAITLNAPATFAGGVFGTMTLRAGSLITNAPASIATGSLQLLADALTLGTISGDSTTVRFGTYNGSRAIRVGGTLPSPDLVISSATIDILQLTGASTIALGTLNQQADIVFEQYVTFPYSLEVLAGFAPSQIIINASPDMLPGTSLSFFGTGFTVILNDSLITPGVPITFLDSVRLGSPDITIATTGGGSPGANILFGLPLDSGLDPSNLTLDAGIGTISFDATVGASAELGSLLVSSASAVFINNNIFSSGPQVYLAPVSVTGNYLVQASGINAAITFGSTLALLPDSTFTIRASEANFSGLVTGPGAFLVIEPFFLTQDITVAGAEDDGTLEITQTELGLFGGLGGVIIGADPGTGTLEVGDATIYTTTELAMAGSGGAIRINRIKPGALNTGVVIRGSQATTEIFNSITTAGGFITILDAVRLVGPNVVLDSTNGGVEPGAPIQIAFALNSETSQTNDLFIQSGNGPVALQGEVGNAPDGQLGNLIINSTTAINLAAPVLRTEEQQSYNGPVSLAANVTIQTNQAPVTFAGDVTGAQNLTIGENTGETTFNGAVGTLNSLIIEAGNTRTFAQSVAVLNLLITGGTVDFQGPTTVQDALMTGGTVTGPGSLTITGLYIWASGVISGTGPILVDTTGTLSIEQPGTKRLERELSNAGTIDWQGGIFNLEHPTLTNLPSGTIRLLTANAWSTALLFPTLHNQGQILALTDTTLANVIVNNTGRISAVSGLLTIADPFGLFSNNGTLEAAEAGRIHIPSNFINAATATVRVVVGDQPEHRPAGQPAITTDFATLDGTLSVAFVGALVPRLTDTYAILEAPFRFGTFSSVIGEGLTNGFFLQQRTPDPQLVVLYSRSTDFSGDNILNLDDLNDYITNFYDPESIRDLDFNADGQVNLDDLGDFITAFYLAMEP
jgi:hypothetical protein